MIPLRDSTRSRRFPLMTLTIIAINVLVWWMELGMTEAELARFFGLFGAVPARYQDLSRALSVVGPLVFMPLITSAFIHAGWLHLIGNMLYLWVFGDNIEDRMGRGRYLLFYLVSAVVSNLAHIVTNPQSTVPTVGASGAVAAVLGAYLLLFPGARVLALVPLGFVFVTEVPAVLFLFLWFILQLLNGIASLGVPASVQGQVAYWAHIGGFVVGMALSLVLSPRRKRYTY